MELRQVRYFLVLAEELNFSRAAARLGIAQPPLSQQIKNLELEVGVRLFRRTPRGAALTEAGQAFLDVVKGMPHQATASILAARRASRGETGSVRVGFTGSAVFNPIVPTAIRAYRRRFPDVEVTLREGNSNYLAAAVLDDALDAAFLRPGAVRLDGLHVDQLDAEPMVAVLPNSTMPDAGLAGDVELRALAAEPFILTPRHLGPTLVDVVLTACAEAGFKPVLGQSAPQIAAVLALVAAEFGVSVVPQSMQQAAVMGVRYLRISDVKVMANLAMVCRREGPTIATRNFVQLVRSLPIDPAQRPDGPGS